MKIYTLTGRSGTGKSFQARALCEKLNIDALIDDGLFIYKGTVVEGESAKREKTKIGAVKAAIFNNSQKANKVRRAINKKKPESILILGTSDGMTDVIMEKLKLDGDVTRIYIDDITTEEDRRIAGEQRNVYGKHVIPAPAMELKKSFAGYFMDQLKQFVGKESERTVVRPTYSYLGDYILNEKVIGDIVKIAARQNEGINRIVMVSQEPSPESYRISVSLKINRGYPVWETSENFQKELNDMIETMTAFNMTEVNIEVRGIA